MDRIQTAFDRAKMKWFLEWRSNMPRPDYVESRNRWFLDEHNIVISTNANGIEKVGFASRGDMLLFVLRWS